MFSEKIRFHTKEDSSSSNKIIIPAGTDFCGIVTLIHNAGKYQVWHIPYRKYWVGIGLPYGTAPSKLLLVETGQDDIGLYARVIREIEPGKSWRRARKELIDLANTMAQELER
jgi:hypothetical protein